MWFRVSVTLCWRQDHLIHSHLASLAFPVILAQLMCWLSKSGTYSWISSELTHQNQFAFFITGETGWVVYQIVQRWYEGEWLQTKRGDLAVRRAKKPWRGLPGEAAWSSHGCPSLDVPKARLAGALGSLSWWLCPCSWQWGWMGLRLLLTQGILWFYDSIYSYSRTCLCATADLFFCFFYFLIE